jgi:hypothetical protein
MLILRIEKINLYLSIRHVEKCSGFILITMAFHKFNHCIETNMVYFTVWKAFEIHSLKNKVMLFLKIEEKKWFIWTCHVEKSSVFILIYSWFYKFKHRHSKLAIHYGISIFDSKSQDQIFVTINNWKEKFIYNVSARWKMLWFNNIYESIHKFSHCNDKSTWAFGVWIDFIFILTRIMSCYI